jgi:hypothetical protein
MHDGGGKVSDAKTPGGARAPGGPALCDIEGFGPVVSLQIAARAARCAAGSRTISEEPGRAAPHTPGKAERGSLAYSFTLVMALAIGVVTFAFITYLVTSVNLLALIPLPT